MQTKPPNSQSAGGKSEPTQQCFDFAADYATLRIKQIRDEPLPRGGGFEQMARRRYQKPVPKKRGEQWSILVREDVVINGRRKRKLKRVPLGPTSICRADAERLRDEYVAGINHPNVGIGGACLFRDFVQTYRRDILPTLASTSRDRSVSVLKNYLIPEFGELMLREITLEPLQGYFARLQQGKLSFESIDKIRDVLSAVLRTAVDYGRLLNNPAEKIRLKRRRAPRPQAFSENPSILRVVGRD